MYLQPSPKGSVASGRGAEAGEAHGRQRAEFLALSGVMDAGPLWPLSPACPQGLVTVSWGQWSHDGGKAQHIRHLMMKQKSHLCLLVGDRLYFPRCYGLGQRDESLRPGCTS